MRDGKNISRPERQERLNARRLHPFRGLAVVLGAILAFLLVLVAITALVHWVMM